MWVCRPEWCSPSHLPSLWLFRLPGSFSSREHAVLRLGEDAGWGMGPRVRFHGVGHFPTWHSDCISLPPTPVSQYTEFILNTLSSSVLPCFSSGILEVTFLSGGITDDIINLREVGTGGARKMSVAFKPVCWHPREESCCIGTQYTCWYMWMYGFP